MPFYVFAWIASIFYGLEVILGKFISKYSIKNPWFFNFVWNSIILLGLAIISLIKGISLPEAFGNLFLAGFFYALGSIFYVLALYRLDISVLTPLYNFRTALAVILGAIVLGEVLSAQQYMLVGVVFVAGIFVSLDEKWSIKSFFNRSVAVALADMVFLALMALFTNKAINQLDFWSATFWIAFIAQILLFATIPMFRKEISQVKKTQILSLSAVAITGVFATLAVNKAYESNIGITSVIISVPISMFAAILFSFFKPDLLEKHTITVYVVRLVAASFMVLAALKLTA
ncbi:MAG: EamA family transporter [Candidatus Doudnabacteria bacterium]|nr:EamA family transporter [Candidatus Doudnabacteria bacterium]